MTDYTSEIEAAQSMAVCMACAVVLACLICVAVTAWGRVK